MADGGPDARHLVGRHGRPDARAADQDPAVRLTRLDRLAEAPREVRVVVGRVRTVAAEIDQLVTEARARQTRDQLVLQGSAGVIGGEGDAHAGYRWSGAMCPKWPPSTVGIRPWRPSRTTRRPTSVTRSAVNPKCSKIVAAGADAP